MPLRDLSDIFIDLYVGFRRRVGHRDCHEKFRSGGGSDSVRLLAACLAGGITRIALGFLLDGERLGRLGRITLGLGLPLDFFCGEACLLGPAGGLFCLDLSGFRSDSLCPRLGLGATLGAYPLAQLGSGALCGKALLHCGIIHTRLRAEAVDHRLAGEVGRFAPGIEIVALGSVHHA
ncbi:hypothetical protein [Roseococcus sp. MDT2-1-1]|nr:hypothetical protein [Roseococcus sp. MDT2-1-1]